MNSPTIAAMVPGLKPQAERSSASSDSNAAQGGSFANVLAEQASASHSSEAQGDTTPATAESASKEAQAANERSSSESQEHAAVANDKDQADTEDAVLTLPQIALEIASHSRDQAAWAKTSSAEAETSLRTNGLVDTDQAPGRRTASEQGVATADLRTHSTATQADDILNTSKQAPNVTGAGAHGIAGLAASMAATEPGATRTNRQQATVNSAVSAAVAQGRADSGLSNGMSAEKASGQREAFDSNLFAAARERLNLIEPTGHDSRLQPHTDLSAVASSNSAGFNPFAAQATAAGPTAGPVIATPLQQAGWNTDFSRQVVMLARDVHSGMQTAELRLDPPDLGPLRISLSLSDGTASALFVSAHASVRQAVEAALPQLSQQLAQAGISLGETHVGDQGQAGFAFNENNGRGTRDTGAKAADGTLAADSAMPPTRAVASHSLVDTFA